MTDVGAAQTADASGSPRWTPVFPLPNVVLLPRVVLPLHIFEQRYRTMTADALSGPRLIAMALLNPGYEPHYYSQKAPIRDVVCVGKILREERLDDGRYNVLLQGVERARIIAEDHSLPYRRAQLAPIQVPNGQHGYVYRHELLRQISTPPMADWASRAGWPELFNCPNLPFSDIVDVIASAILCDTTEKQAFLEEADLSRRCKRLCAELSVLTSNLEVQAVLPRRPRAWPPAAMQN